MGCSGPNDEHLPGDFKGFSRPSVGLQLPELLVARHLELFFDSLLLKIAASGVVLVALGAILNGVTLGGEGELMGSGRQFSPSGDLD